MYKRMLLCVSEATPKEVVQVAIKLCSKNTRVYVLHVVHLLKNFTRRDAMEKFSWVLESLKKAGLKSQMEILESTDVGKAIISFAKEISCDVIVTGTIPRKRLLGVLAENVSTSLVKNAPSAVVLVRRAGEIV